MHVVGGDESEEVGKVGIDAMETFGSDTEIVEMSSDGVKHFLIF